MFKSNQQTLRKSVTFEGIGLHTGKTSKIKVIPGEENLGIVFKRIDLKDNNTILANFKNVSSAKLCTTIRNEYGVKVSTVEHLLAALYFADVDNAIIEINNEEVPIMDGSAKDFLESFNKIGIKEQNKKRKYLIFNEKIELEDNGRTISIEPNASSFEVDFQLDYQNEIIGDQRNNVNFSKDSIDDICQSRTFCLFEDIEKIKQMGLAKGGSLDNALVVDKDKILNKGGLRNEKEFVNHKILDLAGDFLLSGYRILGKVSCYQGGHELTNMFLKKIFKTSSYTCLELKDIIITKKNNANQLERLAVSA
tara:strand:- start:407 stop:1330 length:924 start_codon:yes stop_codon:yes gene_type:complete